MEHRVDLNAAATDNSAAGDSRAGSFPVSMKEYMAFSTADSSGFMLILLDCGGSKEWWLNLVQTGMDHPGRLAQVNKGSPQNSSNIFSYFTWSRGQGDVV